jgi:hypothetical protein
VNDTDYTVEQWNRVDVTLRSARSYPHPDTDVGIRATFTSADGSTIELPGFWDGGEVWKVRFAPTQLGRWTYVVTATDASDSGLHGVSGVIDAVPYTGDLDIYRHGFVQVTADRRAFEYADGTPFLWLGNTHWQAPNYERLDASNNPHIEGESQFRITADHDKARGFTVYQTYPDAALNDGGGNVSVVNWWTENYTHLDPEAFRVQFDVMMDYLADSGTVIALGLGVHTQSGQIGAAAMTHFAQYVVARYAAHPIVWITGQEVDIENEQGKLSTWRAVAETIAANDGYHHPLGAHMYSVGEPKTFGQEPWHDWFPTQGGHEGIRTQEHYRSYWDHEPRKPFLETEANYEGIWDVPGEAPRQSAWKAMQCGSYGYTYGAAGVWAIKWDYDVPGWDDFQNGVPWFDGLRLPGGDQMTILREFYLSLGDWQRLRPSFGDPAYGSFADPERSVLSTDGGSAYVVYFYGPELSTGSLAGMDDTATYSASWFDPRSGASLPISDAVVATGGSWDIPDKPDAEDWVLLVTS